MTEHSKYWRPSRPHNGSNMGKKIYKDIPATRIFDNVWFIGNDMYGSYLLTTSEGLIMLDCMEPGFFGCLEQHIIDAGFDPKNLKAILVTHGHGDHYGDAGIFQEKYGTKVYMTEVDEAFAHDPNQKRPPGQGPMPFNADAYLIPTTPDKPGVPFVLGDTKIDIYSTPGHTPGTASFVFTVYDCGVPHKFMMWGGTGPNREVDMINMQIASVDWFDQVCKLENIEGELGNHPFTDNFVEKLDLINALVDGVKHPLITGYDGVHSMLMMYREIYETTLVKRSKGDMSSNFALK